LILYLGNFEDVPNQPNLFDTDREEVSSTVSDDFIVVSKVFDLDTPLDHHEIRKRLKCDGNVELERQSSEVVGNTEQIRFDETAQQIGIFDIDEPTLEDIE